MEFVLLFVFLGLTAALGTLARYEVIIVIGLLICGGAFALYRRWRRPEEDGQNKEDRL